MIGKIINNLFLNTKIRIVEILLIIFSILFVFFSIVYSLNKANELKIAEKNQVKFWVTAIQNKVKILKLSNEIVDDLKIEERRKIKIYSTASNLILYENDNEKLLFLLDILKLNQNIPVLITDSKKIIKHCKNIENEHLHLNKVLDTIGFKSFLIYPPIEISNLSEKQYIYYKDSKIFEKLKSLTNYSDAFFYSELKNNIANIPIVIIDKHNKLIYKSDNIKNIRNKLFSTNISVYDLIQNGNSFKIELINNNPITVYYKESNFISIFKWFPIIVYLFLGIIVMISIIAIRNIQSIEKKSIWVGMSKETAHQLGTPISSLIGWVELIKENNISIENKNVNIIDEMQKDIDRLSLVADRFSKIGSKPKLSKINVNELLIKSKEYFALRISNNIEIEFIEKKVIYANCNSALLEWVFENLIRNSIDSLNIKGKISLVVDQINNINIIDIVDNGKGMDKDTYQKIFNAGFTTKKRGWGLGLSLCKRIIEEYFDGKIFVKYSKIGEGTCIRIEL